MGMKPELSTPVLDLMLHDPADRFAIMEKAAIIQHKIERNKMDTPTKVHVVSGYNNNTDASEVLGVYSAKADANKLVALITTIDESGLLSDDSLEGLVSEQVVR